MDVQALDRKRHPSDVLTFKVDELQAPVDHVGIERFRVECAAAPIEQVLMFRMRQISDRFYGFCCNKRFLIGWLV